MKIGAKNTGGYSVTVSLGKVEEDILQTGQIGPPTRGKTPYIGNQEMSDKLRNRL